jgi:hypothetical protein
MSDTSPVFQKEEEAKLFFPALKAVAGCRGETEAATRKKKFEQPEPESLSSRR